MGEEVFVPAVLFFRAETPTNIRTGKIIPTNRPARRAPCSRPKPYAPLQRCTSAERWLKSETKPVSHGPTEAPRSPKIAKMPNMAVPPLGNLAEVRLKVPGHIRLTDNPHRAAAKRDIEGIGENTTTA